MQTLEAILLIRIAAVMRLKMTLRLYLMGRNRMMRKQEMKWL